MGGQYQSGNKPSNPTAERDVLGCILRDGALLKAAGLSPRDFAEERHRHVWAAATAVQERGDLVDVLTVGAELMARSRLEAVGGAMFLGDLVEDIGTTVGFEHHARIVAELAKRRRIIATALDLANKGLDPGVTVEELSAEAETAFKPARSQADLDTRAPLAGDVFLTAAARLLARANGDEKPIPLPWPSVAKVLGGGLWPGLHVLVGGTGTGKTQWALQTALGAAVQGFPVLYVGLELGELDITARLAALLDENRSVHWSALFKGEIKPEEMGRLLAAAHDRLKPLPLRVEFADPYTGSWTAATLRDRAVALVNRNRAVLRTDEDKPKRPFLVVLDFLQIIGSPPGDRSDIRERIQQASYAGRAIARELSAAVLLLSSTARANYDALVIRGSGKEHTTTLEDVEHDAAQFVGLGKESGEVEYSADTLLTLVREAVPKDAPPPPHGKPIHLAVAKVRAGPTGYAELRFNGTRFREPSPDTNDAERTWRDWRDAHHRRKPKGDPKGDPEPAPPAKRSFDPVKAAESERDLGF